VIILHGRCQSPHIPDAQGDEDAALQLPSEQEGTVWLPSETANDEKSFVIFVLPQLQTGFSEMFLMRISERAPHSSHLYSYKGIPTPCRKSAILIIRPGHR